MKVFVAGATGVVGQPAVRELVAAGHDVTAVARSAAKAQLVHDLGARAVEVDLFDPAAVAGVVAGHDAVVNLATKIPPLSQAIRAGAWEENHRIRRDVSRNLVDAALAGDVPRYVQESLAFFYEDRGDQWIDETVPVDLPPVARTARDAEAQAARMTEAGRTGIVLRFGVFYGPAGSHTRELLRLVRRRFSPVMGRATSYQASIHTHDAGSAVAAALHVPAGVYNVVDDQPLTRREYADALAVAAGAGRALIPPRWITWLLGENARALARSQRVSNKRFRQATGWAPRYPNAREGWSASLADLRGDAA